MEGGEARGYLLSGAELLTSCSVARIFSKIKRKRVIHTVAVPPARYSAGTSGDLSSALQCICERHFICVLEVGAKGQAAGELGQFDRMGMETFREIENG